MGIFRRLADVIKSNLNDLIDKAEDPEKMLEQMIREMDANYRTAKVEVAKAIADEAGVDCATQGDVMIAVRAALVVAPFVAIGKRFRKIVGDDEADRCRGICIEVGVRLAAAPQSYDKHVFVEVLGQVLRSKLAFPVAAAARAPVLWFHLHSLSGYANRGLAADRLREVQADRQRLAGIVAALVNEYLERARAR